MFIHPTTFIEFSAKIGKMAQTHALPNIYMTPGEDYPHYLLAVVRGNPQYLKFYPAALSFILIGAGAAMSQDAIVNRSIYPEIDDDDRRLLLPHDQCSRGVRLCDRPQCVTFRSCYRGGHIFRRRCGFISKRTHQQKHDGGAARCKFCSMSRSLLEFRRAIRFSGSILLDCVVAALRAK